MKHSNLVIAVSDSPTRAEKQAHFFKRHSIISLTCLIARFSRTFFIFIVFCIIALPAGAKHEYHEKTYQMAWCEANNGRTEYILNDKCRVDCLTKTHAIEFDFANKWAESVGQALYYGIQTNRKPGVVLIIEDPQKDLKYVQRLERVANSQGIDFWIMYKKDLIAKKY